MLTGGTGNNQLTGGAGIDKFCISTGIGRDVITDYTAGEDKLKLPDELTKNDLTIRAVGNDVRINYGNDLLAIVQDSSITDLTFI